MKNNYIYTFQISQNMCSRSTCKFYLVLFLFFHTQFNLFAQIQKDSIAYFENKLQIIDDKDIDSTLFYYNQLSNRLSGEKLITVLRRKAFFLSDYGSNIAAERTYLKALELSQKINNRLLEAEIYHDLGYYFYDKLNNTPVAYKNFLLAQDIFIEEKAFDELFRNKSNIASLLAQDGEYSKAKKLFNESLVYYQNNKDTINIVYTKINLASLYRETKEYKKCEDYFYNILNTATLKERETSLIYYNLAVSSFEQEKFNNADILIDKSINISEYSLDKMQLIDLYFFKAEVAKEIKNYKKSLKYYKKSLIKAKEIEDYPFQEHLLENIIAVSVKNHNYTNIDSLYKEISDVKDSIGNKEISNTLNEIYLENTLNKQEKEILIHQSNLKNEKELTKLYISIIILSSLFLLALIAYLISYRKNNYKRLLLLENKIKIKEIENKTIRKFEIKETKRIQEDLKAKKKELLIDLSFGEKRVKTVKQVFKRIEMIENRSIITKKDILDLKLFIQNKYEFLITTESVKKDLAFTNKEFYDGLLKDFPKLSKTELKILSYIGVNFDTKEIANIQNVSVDAIRKTRYRIRKKINLKPEDSLEKFILKYL